VSGRLSIYKTYEWKEVREHQRPSVLKLQFLYRRLKPGYEAHHYERHTNHEGRILIGPVCRDDGQAEKDEWEDHPVLWEYTGKELPGLAEKCIKATRNHTATVKNADEQIEKLCSFVETTLIRFRPESIFLDTGVLVVVLPDNYMADFACEQSEEINVMLGELKQRVDQEYVENETRQKIEYRARHENTLDGYQAAMKNGMMLQYHERLYASFPDLYVKRKELKKIGVDVSYTLSEYRDKTTRKFNKKNQSGKRPNGIRRVPVRIETDGLRPGGSSATSLGH
jgi:hypothetical protein